MNNLDLLKEGERAILERRFTDAIALMDKALQQNANDAGALYLKAQALSNSDKFNEAIVVFDKLLQMINEDPGWQADILISKSDALIELNKLDEADNSLDNALGIKPRLARGWIHKARIAARRGNFHKSLEYCERAISVGPNDPRGWNNKAFALFKLKRYKECIASAKKALSIKPDYAQAYIHMANAYNEMGKIRRAKKCEEEFQKIFKKGGPSLEHTVGHKPMV